MLDKIKYPTLKYTYEDDEEEFIFCIKGKPFPCLVSPKLPTPTSTLLDYDVVRDLGLKMTNLQCQRYQFAGQKLRILGIVSLTVQCIVDGAMCGTTRLKAQVVQNLTKFLDVECLAGTKMAAQLKGNTICTSSGALTPPLPSQHHLLDPAHHLAFHQSLNICRPRMFLKTMPLQFLHIFSISGD